MILTNSKVLGKVKTILKLFLSSKNKMLISYCKIILKLLSNNAQRSFSASVNLKSDLSYTLEKVSYFVL